MKSNAPEACPNPSCRRHSKCESFGMRMGRRAQGPCSGHRRCCLDTARQCTRPQTETCPEALSGSPQAARAAQAAAEAAAELQQVQILREEAGPTGESPWFSSLSAGSTSTSDITSSIMLARISTLFSLPALSLAPSLSASTSDC